jgi:uncharacterized protein YegJ (DUF2314 family)
MTNGNDEDDDSIHPIGRTATRTNGDAVVYNVDENDQQMDHATARARKHVDRFIAALQHPAANQRDFQVKKLFVKDGKAEHIWLSDVKFNGNRFVGVVDNKPMYVKDLKIGAKASVNPDEVIDWSYVEDGYLVGGYTIRVLYSELSPEEKADFEKRADFHIGHKTH